MRIYKPVLALGATLVLSAFAARAPMAPHDPCKVLTAEKFSKIMGYAAVVKTTGSTAMTCYYTGASEEGGMFMIMTETAAGPGADAMMKRKGGPPEGSGLVGGIYRQGSIIFTVSIRGTDKAKLEALVAEIKRGLS
jgi:hypothetical protein